MAELLPHQAFLAELHASGLTWAEVARMTGASSGDMARKVATGVKPGANLVGNVRHVMQTGEGATAPAPRRRAATGELARVRAKPAAAGERPSSVPARAHFTVSPRRLHRDPDGQLKWTQTVSVPKSEGIGRERGRAAIVDALGKAGKGRHDRVQFRITLASGRSGLVGGKAGYSTRRARAAVKREGEDPYAWLADQVGHGTGSLGAGFEASDIVSVEVITL